MAFRSLMEKISSPMFLQKNRTCVTAKPEVTLRKGPPCEDRSCNPKKKGFWGRLFAKKTDYCEDAIDSKRSPEECCKVKFYDPMKQDPDLSHFEGQAYKTCGPAYIVQKDLVGECSDELSKEDRIIRRIETHPDIKDLMDDPVPTFKNVPLRMLEISDRRLHPLYKKLRSTPRVNPHKPQPTKPPFYESVCGPIDPTEIPVNIKFNKELLEKKNLYSEFKRVEPPRELVGRLVEMRRNAKPTLENIGRPVKFELKPSRYEEATRKKYVFDTLKQTVDVKND